MIAARLAGPRRLAALWLAAALAAIGGGAADAHPHVWIEATLSPVFAGRQVTAFDITWTFDDFYSELVRQDFDQNGDGNLSQSELDALVGISAANLVEFSFFTHLRIGQERLRVTRVQAFYAEEAGELILYRFRVPLPEPVDPAVTPLAVGLFDETYYVDILLIERDVALDPASGCAVRLEQDLEQPLYFGTFFPTYATLDCHGD